MNKELQNIIDLLQESLHGDPWYGRSMQAITSEVEPSSAYVNPEEKGHSPIELLYHMITWAEVVENRLKDEALKAIASLEQLDWRKIDPTVHTWRKGLSLLKDAHQRIINLLQHKDDTLLDAPVAGKKYDFRTMLHGLIQHNIYHLGQIAYIKKLLD